MLDLKVGEIVEVWEGVKLVDGKAEVVTVDDTDAHYEILYRYGSDVGAYWFTGDGKWNGSSRGHYLKKKEAKPYAPQFKVGDKVYCLMYGKGEVKNLSHRSRYPIGVRTDSGCERTYSSKLKWETDCKSTLFHLDAITFDTLGRPVAIDWNYKPSREEKKVVTKLPHEFKKDEDVLYAAYSEKVWGRAKFVKAGAFRRYFIRDSRIQRSHDGSENLLPYKGNEHMEGCLLTDSKLGAFPEGYEVPDVQKSKKSKKPKLKLGKACLCRDYESDKWELKTFVAKALGEGVEYPYLTINDEYRYCIPYKGNEYLEGTSESPDKEDDKTK